MLRAACSCLEVVSTPLVHLIFTVTAWPSQDCKNEASHVTTCDGQTKKERTKQVSTCNFHTHPSKLQQQHRFREAAQAAKFFFLETHNPAMHVPAIPLFPHSLFKFTAFFVERRWVRRGFETLGIFCLASLLTIGICIDRLDRTVFDNFSIVRF